MTFVLCDMCVDEKDEYVHVPVDPLPDSVAAVWPYADHLLQVWTEADFGHA